MSMFRDWRYQVSWGRICACCSLVVAVWREFTGADLQHVALWLLSAIGSYGQSKVTEIVAILRKVGIKVPTAQGKGDESTPSDCATDADLGTNQEGQR